MQYAKTIGTLALAGYLSLAQGCGTIAGACKGAYYGAKNDYKTLVETFSTVKDTKEEESTKNRDSQSQLSKLEKFQMDNESDKEEFQINDYLQESYKPTGRTPAQ